MTTPWASYGRRRFLSSPCPSSRPWKPACRPSTIRKSLPIIAGTIAYVWLLLAIYLSTRPRRLDRLIGLPKVYMIHGIMSLGAILLAWLHMQGSPSAGLIKQTGNIAFYLFLGWRFTP